MGVYGTDRRRVRGRRHGREGRPVAKAMLGTDRGGPGRGIGYKFIKMGLISSDLGIAAVRTAATGVSADSVGDPAFNQDRGPISILDARLHWEF